MTTRLHRVQDDYLKCRSWGHMWDDYRPLGRDRGDYVLTLRCDRCATERVDTLDSAGDVIRRNYEYPEDYKISGYISGDRATAPELRRELLTRKRREMRATPTRARARLRAVS